MKRYLPFLIVILASYSLAKAQHEVRCQLLDRVASDWNNTLSHRFGLQPGLLSRLNHFDIMSFSLRFESL